MWRENDPNTHSTSSGSVKLPMIDAVASHFHLSTERHSTMMLHLIYFYILLIVLLLSKRALEHVSYITLTSWLNSHFLLWHVLSAHFFFDDRQICRLATQSSVFLPSIAFLRLNWNQLKWVEEASVRGDERRERNINDFAKILNFIPCGDFWAIFLIKKF